MKTMKVTFGRYFLILITDYLYISILIFKEAFEKKDVFELQFRFPCSKWKEANEYFSN